MGRGAGLGTATMARAEIRDPAAGAQADVGALRQPVGNTAEEHLACVHHCRSGPRLQRDADQRRDLSAAGGIYDRGPDLLCDPVPGHACRATVRTWPDLRQVLTRAWTDWREAKFGLMPYHQPAGVTEPPMLGKLLPILAVSRCRDTTVGITGLIAPRL